MSLQDDIFDLREALKGKPEAKALERLEKHIEKLEAIFDQFIWLDKSLKSAAAVFQYYWDTANKGGK